MVGKNSKGINPWTFFPPWKRRKCQSQGPSLGEREGGEMGWRMEKESTPRPVPCQRDHPCQDPATRNAVKGPASCSLAAVALRLVQVGMGQNETTKKPQALVGKRHCFCFTMLHFLNLPCFCFHLPGHFGCLFLTHSHVLVGRELYFAAVQMVQGTCKSSFMPTSSWLQGTHGIQAWKGSPAGERNLPIFPEGKLRHGPVLFVQTTTLASFCGMLDSTMNPGARCL